MEKLVKPHYPDGLCPDCYEEIAFGLEEGEECWNCGHVFWCEDYEEVEGNEFDD